MIRKLFILLSLFSFNTFGNGYQYGTGGIGMGMSSPGYMSNTYNEQLTESEVEVVKRFKVHMQNGTRPNKADINVLRKPEVYNQIYGQIIYDRGSDEFRSEDYSKIQNKIFKTLIGEQDYKKVKDFISRKRPSNRRKREKAHNFEEFDAISLKQITYDFIQRDLSSAGFSSTMSEKDKEFTIARQQELTLKRFGSKLEGRVKSLLAQSSDGLIVLDAGDTDISDFELMQYFYSYLSRREKMSDKEIYNFVNERVVNPYQKNLIDAFVNRENVPSIAIKNALTDESKWNYLKMQLYAAGDSDAVQRYEQVRSRSIVDCSFEPQKFSDQTLMNDIEYISNQALSESSREMGSCSEKLDDFSKAGTKAQKLKQRLSALRDKGTSAKYQGDVDNLYWEEDYSNDINPDEEEYLIEQNILATSISDFLEAGCELAEGNSKLLSVATKFTETLSKSASALSLSPELSLLAGTVSAVTSLTSTLMKLFSKETDIDVGNRVLENMNNRHSFLEQMCQFKGFVYDLDKVLAGNYENMQVFQNAIDANLKEISSIENEISCIASNQGTDEVTQLIQNIDNINLNNFAECFDFMKPIYNPHAKVRKTMLFYELYLQRCTGLGNQPSFCDSYEDIRMEAASSKSAGAFCTSDNINTLVAVFDDMKESMNDELISNDSKSRTNALSRLQGQLSSLSQENSRFRNDLSQIQGAQLTEDMKTYVEKTGNALFSGDDNSPLTGFFKDSKKALNELKEQYKDKADIIKKGKLSKAQLCDKAKSAQSDLNVQYEQVGYVQAFCNTFQIKSRVPFKSSFSTNAFIKPEVDGGLDEQCREFTNNHSYRSIVSSHEVNDYYWHECQSGSSINQF